MPQCPRCRRPLPAAYGPASACAYCGQSLSAPQWVAAPPGSHDAAPPRHGRYLGPPAYTHQPRWGFPLLTWRSPTSFEPVPASHAQRAKALAGTAEPLLWLAAAVSLLAAAAELWRYRLLLDSRFDALPAGRLRVSDALVVTGGVVAALACGLAALVMLLWVLRAYAAAAEFAGVRPSRSSAVLLAGWLLPGANLLVPGSTLAEIEHASLRRPPGRRPVPSRLVRSWWVAWAASVLLAWIALAWSLRESTQAKADGVLLHVAVDVAAALAAALTAIVVRSLTRLLQPVAAGRIRRMRVVRVKAAAETATAIATR
jgi:Domain of unknown function (DUF4328)